MFSPKRQFEEAHEELVTHDIIDRADWSKLDEGWEVTYYPGRRLYETASDSETPHRVVEEIPLLFPEEKAEILKNESVSAPSQTPDTPITAPVDTPISGESEEKSDKNSENHRKKHIEPSELPAEPETTSEPKMAADEGEPTDATASATEKSTPPEQPGDRESEALSTHSSEAQIQSAPVEKSAETILETEIPHDRHEPAMKGTTDNLPAAEQQIETKEDSDQAEKPADVTRFSPSSVTSRSSEPSAPSVGEDESVRGAEKASYEPPVRNEPVDVVLPSSLTETPLSRSSVSSFQLRFFTLSKKGAAMNGKQSGDTHCDIRYLLAWTTRSRNRVLTDDVAQKTRQIVREVCAVHEAKIVKVTVTPDSVQIEVVCPPTVTPAALVDDLKERTLHALDTTFPALKQQFWGLPLWSGGFICLTIGDNVENQLNAYLDGKTPVDEDVFQVVSA
ncbi:MAG: IS200/IS605 family transposase [candidate division Zixibacteria bacterium]|nr:IS200/IS605 family transposase [candidate division Zixibacteria bacterium]